MTVRRLAALGFLFASPCMARNCRWMNSATASDLLGGSARVAVTGSACSFTWKRGNLWKSIRIEVQPLPPKGIKPYLRRCAGAAAPVTGLGNEAFACRVKAKRGIVVERIAGRVRNRTFVVEASANERHTHADRLFDIAKQAAAQVAGNLF
ncbi:MAG: hypothetical protein ACRD4O_15915 [Bryobacteraceae bacterium]